MGVEKDGEMEISCNITAQYSKAKENKKRFDDLGRNYYNNIDTVV